MGKVYTTDVGTRIKLDTEANIVAASDHHIVALPPDGSAAVELDTSIVETTKLQHDKTALTLVIAGVWELQAYVEIDGENYTGEKCTLVVHAPIV